MVGDRARVHGSLGELGEEPLELEAAQEPGHGAQASHWLGARPSQLGAATGCGAGWRHSDQDKLPEGASGRQDRGARRGRHHRRPGDWVDDGDGDGRRSSLWPELRHVYGRGRRLGRGHADAHGAEHGRGHGCAGVQRRLFSGVERRGSFPYAWRARDAHAHAAGPDDLLRPDRVAALWLTDEEHHQPAALAPRDLQAADGGGHQRHGGRREYYQAPAHQRLGGEGGPNF
mmetsp:Transcript_25152/g.52051  ORF Transcript_25152/g.52051 Transcript_25152/m.52051 type:complete len:230 (+) Transcript_25152:872-1561(+)